MRKFVHLFAIAVTLGWVIHLSADPTADYSSLEIPKPPFPKPYQNCVVYPQSQSPDHKYGFLYPARSVVFDLDKVDMYLITLKPFGFVDKMPAYDGHLAISSGGFFVANWAKDSSAVVMMYGGRWGPEDVYLVPIHDGKVGKIIDLTAEITKLAEPDFKKSKADSFNSNFDFLFDDSDHVKPTDNDNVIRDSGWTINDHNQVIINCTLASNPKHDPDTKSWVVTVKGLWDIAQGKFISVKLTRTFSGEYKE
jgi:hypothetical protein